MVRVHAGSIGHLGKSIGPGIFKHLCDLLPGIRKGWLHKVVQKADYSSLVLGHILLKDIVSPGLIAENIRNLDSQVCNLPYIPGIVIVSADSLGIICHEHLLAEIRPCGILHKWKIAGIVQSEDPAVQSSFLCSHCTDFLHIVRKTGKIRAVCQMKLICI